MEMGAGIIAAVGGAALLAAMAFRQMVSTVMKLNDELQETIQERRASETQRDALQVKVTELETQLTIMQARLEAQAQEIQTLRERLQDCDEAVAEYRIKREALLTAN